MAPCQSVPEARHPILRRLPVVLLLVALPLAAFCDTKPTGLVMSASW